MKHLLIPLSVLILTACNPTAPAVAPLEEMSPGVRPSQTAPEWTAPDDYSFILKSSCGERSLIGRFRVVVTGGRTRARALDERARAFMRYDHGEDVPSLDDLLAEAEEARAAGADVVEIEHGAKDGHPTSINIDYMKNAIDDGACYVISDYSERT